MKSFTTFAGTLCLAVVWVLALPEASAMTLPLLPKTNNSLTVPIMLAAVMLCLAIGVVLRAFSKPEAELSLNQRPKIRRSHGGSLTKIQTTLFGGAVCDQVILSNCEQTGPILSLHTGGE